MSSTSLSVQRSQNLPTEAVGKSPIESIPTDQDVEEGAPASGKGLSIHDILLFFGFFILLVWPWIFFAVVWAREGIKMNNYMAKVVTNHPHATTYFITLICSIISMIVSVFFSFAIVRFSQELVTHLGPNRPFHLRVLLAFRHQAWPGWGLKDFKSMMTKNRWWPAALVVICVATFAQLTSTTTSLITPGRFNRTEILTGTELDFSSTDASCLAWFRANPRSNDCGWQLHNGLAYTGCLGENQMVDVLGAGRGNILALLSNNSESLTFSQLGVKDGLHFLGSIRGVLPIGPNGVPAFDTLKPSPFSNAEIAAGMISYNYTLNHQGFFSNVSCRYEATSPLNVTALVPGSRVALQYNANCAAQGETEVLANVTFLPSINGKNTLIYWACQSPSNGMGVPSYSIYLQGRNFYNETIGNITCTISPAQTAIFPVTFYSTQGIFSTNESITPSPIAFPSLINDALVALGSVIYQSQNFQANLVAESVITFAVKSFGLKPSQIYHQSPLYLRLYERMIQGILEYETTYIRLIYSTVPNPPSSCIRTVTGSLTYEILGWFVTKDNIGFLIPLTMINLGGLVALFLAVVIAKGGGYILHPFHPRPVTYRDDDEESQVPEEWRKHISFRPITILKDLLQHDVKDAVITGLTNTSQAAAEMAVEQVESQRNAS